MQTALCTSKIRNILGAILRPRVILQESDCLYFSLQHGLKRELQKDEIYPPSVQYAYVKRVVQILGKGYETIYFLIFTFFNYSPINKV
jgi:hypothetical protein